jgi:hypothetical protein
MLPVAAFCFAVKENTVDRLWRSEALCAVSDFRVILHIRVFYKLMEVSLEGSVG